jgi:hypothetical protein
MYGADGNRLTISMSEFARTLATLKGLPSGYRAGGAADPAHSAGPDFSFEYL